MPLPASALKGIKERDVRREITIESQGLDVSTVHVRIQPREGNHSIS